MLYHVTIGDRTLAVELGAEGVTVEGEPASAELRRIDGTRIHSLLLDGASHRIVATRRRGEGIAGGGAWHLNLRGRTLVADVVDERTRAIREMTGAGAGPGGPSPVRAPMPGLVVRVEVEEGDEVEAGRGLVIVEAMKMENELRAEAAGRIKAVRVEEGSTVEKDEILIEFEPPAEEEG